MSAALLSPPSRGEASGLFLIEGGPQVSHVFTADALPIVGMTTASYVFGYDVSGGGFGSTALKVRTDLAYMTPLELFGANVGVGASYFWDRRSIQGEEVEASGSFQGFSFGLALGR